MRAALDLIVAVTDWMAERIGAPAAKAWMWLTGSHRGFGASLLIVAALSVDFAQAFHSGSIFASTWKAGLMLLTLLLLRSGLYPYAQDRPPSTGTRSIQPFELAMRACILGSVPVAIGKVVGLALWPDLKIALDLFEDLTTMVAVLMWLADGPSVRSTAKDLVIRLLHRPQVAPQPVG